MVTKSKRKRKAVAPNPRKQKDYAPTSRYRRQNHWEYAYGYGQVVKLCGRSAGDVWLFLRYACQRWDRNHITISVREISDTLNMGMSTVQRCLLALRGNDLLEVDPIEPGRALTYIVDGEIKLSDLASKDN